ncbi:uncharacterized protein LOC131325462 isoform X1 [Rhododendron vialii]|uniref:uncharacterized protein LOC131325462 isoform X1 n=1 Tax=Rhododendron vialii TaxID=182163 RepID=UPI00265F3638|nr:uncharacterized protein LOC131325462 isoform X1 [Rhododendron vialii]
MAYAAACLVVSFQTFDSDMSTDKDAVVLPFVMKAPNLRSGPTSSPTFTSWPPRTAAIPAPCPQNPATRLPPFGAPAKTWCRWHRKVSASLRGDDIVQGNKKLLLGKRFSVPMSRIMIHQPMGGLEGGDIKIRRSRLLSRFLMFFLSSLFITL